MCSSLGPEDEDHDDDDDEGGVAEEAGLLDDAEVLVSVVGFGAGSLLQPATATIAAMVKTVAARRAPCFMSPPWDQVLRLLVVLLLHPVADLSREDHP